MKWAFVLIPMFVYSVSGNAKKIKNAKDSLNFRELAGISEISNLAGPVNLFLTKAESGDYLIGIIRSNEQPSEKSLSVISKTDQLTRMWNGEEVFCTVGKDEYPLAIEAIRSAQGGSRYYLTDIPGLFLYSEEQIKDVKQSLSLPFISMTRESDSKCKFDFSTVRD